MTWFIILQTAIVTVRVIFTSVDLKEKKKKDCVMCVDVDIDRRDVDCVDVDFVGSDCVDAVYSHGYINMDQCMTLSTYCMCCYRSRVKKHQDHRILCCVRHK